ncbi:MAG: hemolysin family protein [Rhodothermales bacterium]
MLLDLLIILLMLALSAFFSGAEIAFVTANRLRVEVQARRDEAVGGVVKGFLEHPETLLTTTLVGNNLALVIYSTLIATFLASPLEAAFLGIGVPETSVGFPIFIGQTLVASVLVLMLGEILPKSVLRELSSQAVFVMAWPLRICYVLLWPLIKISGWTAAGLVRLFGAESDTLERFIRRDFVNILEESKASGALELDEEESELIANVFSMNTILVKASMVPRMDMEAIEDTTPLDVVRERFIETGLSRLPVYREHIDQIIGVAFAYDLFSQPTELADITRPVMFVPETKHSKHLLRDFLREGTSIAIVIDEYGGTAGIVTREDLLEELFGDIQDEYDTDGEILRQLDERSYLVSGRADIDDLKERFGIELPEGDYETVAGYLLDRLGTIPTQRQQVELDGYLFIVARAAPNRIGLVRMIRQD